MLDRPRPCLPAAARRRGRADYRALSRVLDCDDVPPAGRHQLAAGTSGAGDAPAADDFTRTSPAARGVPRLLAPPAHRNVNVPRRRRAEFPAHLSEEPAVRGRPRGTVVCDCVRKLVHEDFPDVLFRAQVQQPGVEPDLVAGRMERAQGPPHVPRDLQGSEGDARRVRGGDGVRKLLQPSKPRRQRRGIVQCERELVSRCSGLRS